MVEKIKVLNALCQKPNYKTVGNWMVRRFERPAALYLTWLFLHTPVSANQVTFLAILTALAGGFFLASGNAAGFLTGALLLQLWYLLDHVDGQVARYRKTSSADGLFYDYVMHHVVNLIPLFACGWTLYRLTGNAAAIFFGYLASVSTELIAVLNDCRSKAVLSSLPLNPVSRPAQSAPSVSPVTNKGFGGVVFSFLHKSCEGHVVMNLLTVMAFIYVFFEQRSPETVTRLFWGSLVFWSAAATLVWTGRTYYFVTRKKISGQLL